jgi:hypothetical protein
MRRGLPAALVLSATLAACGSSHRADGYAGHLYSVQQVERAFAQLGLKLHRRSARESGLVSFRVRRYRSGLPAGRAGTLVVATRPSTVGTAPSLRGRVRAFANVTVSTKPYDVDEVNGAFSALRWGTLAQGKPGKRLIVPGRSIGPIWLGESRKRVEKAFGPGRSTRGGVRYLGGHVLVTYSYHDAPTTYVAYLETRWRGFHTRSGARVGATRGRLRPLFVSCHGKDQCYLEDGPWPDALGTVFAMKDGRVVGIAIGNA